MSSVIMIMLVIVITVMNLLMIVITVMIMLMILMIVIRRGWNSQSSQTPGCVGGDGLKHVLLPGLCKVQWYTGGTRLLMMTTKMVMMMRTLVR